MDFEPRRTNQGFAILLLAGSAKACLAKQFLRSPGPDRVQPLIAIPTALSGPITIGLIVILGVFVYPWLLARPRGPIIVAASTVALAALFVAFESGNSAFGPLRNSWELLLH